MLLKNTKISTKLTILYTILLLSVLIALNSAIYLGITFYTERQVSAELNYVSKIIEQRITSPKGVSSYSNIFDGAPSKEKYYSRILDDKGNLIKAVDNFKYDIPLNTDSNNTADRDDYRYEKDRRYIYVSNKVKTNNGTVYIQVVKDIEYEKIFLEVLKAFMITACFGGIIISIALGSVVSKGMLEPIDKITKAAQSISINNLKERIEVAPKEDELSRLASTFNSMIDRLQGSFEKQNQFVSDASHELRTPIAVIKGYVNLLDRWGKDDKEILEESIEAIKKETENMTVLLEKLLFLARNDSDTQKIHKEKFYLNELIDEIIKESKFISDKHNIYSKINDEIIIDADYKMIKQALRIFVDNSIKFTKEDGEIVINLIRENNFAKIVIRDTGIGIPKEDLAKIFDRFYMVDKARHREKGGSGLGLAIAKLIIENHSGKIYASSETSKGTTITVVLPIENK